VGRKWFSKGNVSYLAVRRRNTTFTQPLCLPGRCRRRITTPLMSGGKFLSKHAFALQRSASRGARTDNAEGTPLSQRGSVRFRLGRLRHAEPGRGWRGDVMYWSCCKSMHMSSVKYAERCFSCIACACVCMHVREERQCLVGSIGMGLQECQY
jgi:hypothetical protein